jgi:high-affinity nickel permease
MLLAGVPLFPLAFFLGVKHAYDADHLVAVSTYIVRSRSLSHTFKMSLSWAVGHMTTAGAITFLLYLYRDLFLSRILAYFEAVVGVMLVLLGIAAILSYRNLGTHHRHDHPSRKEGHVHAHLHEGGEVHQHHHRHMFGIGIVHGLASNDELILLFTASLGVASLLGLVSYVAVFSLGVVGGMVAFGCAISYPFLERREAARKAVGLLGGVSLLYGAVILLL